jgi:hypothetical protein
MQGKRSEAQEAIRLRGGSILDDIDSVKLAKLLSTVGLINGLSASLAPKQSAEQYGLDMAKKGKKNQKERDLTTFIFEHAGSAMLSANILALSLANGGDTTQAIGYSYLPFLALNARNAIQDRATKNGFPAWTQKFLTVVHGFLSWSLITGQSNSPMLSKIGAVWLGINGILGALSPKKFAKSWGQDEKNIGVDAEGMMKFFGYSLLALGGAHGSLVQGAEWTEALGYCYATYLAAAIDGNFVSKTAEKSGLKKGPQYFWMLLEVLAIAKFLR